MDWTVAERDALPVDGNRYEVIDGELFVTPAPAWTHQHAVFLLSRILADYLDRESLGCVVVAPADVVFSATRGVQPDLFVVPLVVMCIEGTLAYGFDSEPLTDLVLVTISLPPLIGMFVYVGWVLRRLRSLRPRTVKA